MTLSRTIACALAAALMGLALAARADLPTLPASGVVGISGTTLAAHPELAGVVIHDDIVPWTDNLGTTGSIQTRVVRENVSGTFDFYFRVFNDAGSKSFLSALRVLDYSGFDPIAVDFRTDGLGTQGADTVKRVGAGGEAGVNFIFSNDADWIQPGQQSRFLLIKTTATEAALRNADLLIGQIGKDHPSALFSVWSPTAVPEPGTYAIMLSGLAMAGLMIRKRMS